MDIKICKKRSLLVTFILAITTTVFAQNPTTKDSLLLAPNLQKIALKQKPASFAASYSYDPKLNLYFYKGMRNLMFRMPIEMENIWAKKG